MSDRVVREQGVRLRVIDGGPLEPEEQQLRLERSRALLKAPEQRASSRLGHVRREAEVSEGERAVEP